MWQHLDNEAPEAAAAGDSASDGVPPEAEPTSNANGGEAESVDAEDAENGEEQGATASAGDGAPPGVAS